MSPISCFLLVLVVVVAQDFRDDLTLKNCRIEANVTGPIIEKALAAGMPEYVQNMVNSTLDRIISKCEPKKACNFPCYGSYLNCVKRQYDSKALTITEKFCCPTDFCK